MYRLLTGMILTLLVGTATTAHAVEFRRFMNLVEEPGLTIMAPGSTIEEWCENYGYGQGIIRVFAVYDVDHRQRLLKLGGSYKGFVENRALPLIRQHCDVEFEMVWLSMLRETDYQYDGTPQIFDIMYFDLRGDQLFYTHYDPVASLQAWTQAERDALEPGAEDAMPTRLPDALYADETVEIYARDTKWCQGFRERRSLREGGLDLVYQVPYERREEIAGHRVGPILERLVNAEKCIPKVTVYQYWAGEEDFWESLEFERINSTYPGGGAVFGVTKRTAGPRLQAARDAFRAKLDLLAWGGGDCEGPYCEFPGGQYLNAIYRADTEAIRRYDALVDARIQRRYVQPLRSVLESLSGQKVRTTFSLLVPLADTYLYNYGSTAMECADDLVRHHVRYELDTYDLYDEYGMYMGQGGGEVFTANYLIKAEFASLCNRICDHLGGQASAWVINELGHRGAELTMQGMEEVQNSYVCNDPTVLQFESNLVRLTEQYLGSKHEWLISGEQ